MDEARAQAIRDRLTCLRIEIAEALAECGVWLDPKESSDGVAE